MITNGYISEIKSKLGSKPWLPGSTTGLWPPDRVFFKDARGFEPYMSEIPDTWSKKLASVLTLLGVAQIPGLNDLVGFLSSVKTPEPLSDAHMNAAITRFNDLSQTSTRPFSQSS